MHAHTHPFPLPHRPKGLLVLLRHPPEPLLVAAGVGLSQVLVGAAVTVNGLRGWGGTWGAGRAGGVGGMSHV